MKVAFFTGHRKIHTRVKPQFTEMIREAYVSGVDHFITGMAVGTDMLAAKILTDFGFSWTAALPCPPEQQCALWHSWEQKQYWKLLHSASEIVLVSPEYSEKCFHLRNLWMAKESELCLAIYDGSPKGGTANTIRLCKKREIPAVILDPNSLKVTRSPIQVQLSLKLDINISL